MNGIIEEIREKMARFDGARIEFDESSITYFPGSRDGFTVRLVVLSGGRESYSVYYDGLHEEFSTREAAIQAFGFGLSTGCSLREFSRGGVAYRWIAELGSAHSADLWKPDWEIYNFFGPFWQVWRRPAVRVLQNRLIDLDDGSDPDDTANELVPAPPTGGLPSLFAAKELPRERKSSEAQVPPPGPGVFWWWQH